MVAPARSMYRNNFEKDGKDRARGEGHVTRHVGTNVEMVSMVTAKRAQMTHE